VSFSLKLENLDRIDPKDVNDSFIYDIIKFVQKKAPQVHEQKNDERKKMEI